MKNWLTYSTAVMPKSFLAIFAKSRWSTFFANSALCSDHSASEILKGGAGSAARAPPTRSSCEATAPAADAARTSRREGLVMWSQSLTGKWLAAPLAGRVLSPEAKRPATGAANRGATALLFRFRLSVLLDLRDELL